ncbi:VOC family protein [Gynuella sunshinyii]|uniref:Putative enzyme-like lactoylglutathione lyase n=1 Tax=Gynuella sunshinyii YC6258 TaxID=1445510 RepID=A0A0C5VIA4_9GAMM|nr:VOC family protein [Gynuella sunshinyii]AJQ94397.1 putative enzyme-like lactoylglutathione lyase [Gynuella sunshinyii YC6258]
MSSIIWADIPVKDLERAMHFYSKVLDVQFRHRSSDSPIAVFEHRPGQVSACLFTSEHEQPSREGIIVYWNVEGRLKAAEALVPGCGGTILRGTHAIEPFGYRSVVLDSEGNRLALHSQAL